VTQLALFAVCLAILAVVVVLASRAREPVLLLPDLPATDRPVHVGRPALGYAGRALLGLLLLGAVVVGLAGPSSPNLAALLVAFLVLPCTVILALATGGLARAPAAVHEERVPAWAAAALALLLGLANVVGASGGRAVAGLVVTYLLATATGRWRAGPAWWRDGDAVLLLARMVGRASPVSRTADGWHRAAWPAGLARPLTPPERAVLAVLLASGLARPATGLHAWAVLLDGRSAVIVLGAFVVLVLYLAGVLALLERALRTGAGVEVGVALVPLLIGLVLANDIVGAAFALDLAGTLLSDPFGTGADAFGTADRTVGTRVLTAAGAGVVELVLVFLGGTLGVLTQRDLDRLDGRRSPVGAAAVAGLTALALALLLAGR
jgi:hypothetical protein